MEKTISELYSWPKVENAWGTSTIDHFNLILDKAPDELDVDDVAFLLRQKMLVDLAIPKAIEELKKDPYCGTMFGGQMLKNLSEYGKIPDEYRESAKSILPILEEYAASHDFEFDEDRAEYRGWLDCLKNNLSQ